MVKGEKKVGKRFLSHRSTKYPCFVPNLGESMGAGRRRLTRDKSRKKLIGCKVIYPYLLRCLIVSEEKL